MVQGWTPAFVVADLGVLATAAALLLGGLIFLGVLLFFSGLRRALGGGSHGINQRLEVFAARDQPVAPTARRAKQSTNLYARIDRAVISRGFGVRLAADLARADLKVTVGEFLVASCVLASVGALIGFALPISGHVVLGLVLLCLGYFAPRVYVRSAKNRRIRAFNGQLADTIGLLSSALRSGYSLLQAMELVSREGAQPISGEFERVVREVGLGLSPEEALANLTRRMASDDLELMVTAINVQREVGGNLAEVLDIIATTIRDRIKLKGEIRVLTAQQQYSGYIIGLLPVALSLILLIINPTYMLGVFRTTHWCGFTMFGCSALMIISGFIVMQRIVDIRV